LAQNNSKKIKIIVMKTSNTLVNGTQIINTLNNTVVAAPIVTTAAGSSFSTADLWSIQRSRRVRTVRKVVFN
jgi:hypothetical protein